MKILILKFRHIGDVLLTTPLIENLKKNFPQASIDVALNEGTEAMLMHHPDLHKIHIYRRQRIKKSPLIQRIKDEIAFIQSIMKERYDILINTTEGERGALLAMLSGARTKIGYPVKKNRLLQHVYTHLLPPQERRHTVEANLDALRIMGWPIAEKRVRMVIPQKARNSLEKKLQKRGVEGAFVHFHPVSRWLFKCLEDQLSAKIIDFCQQSLNLSVVLSAAPLKEELEKIASIKTLCQCRPVDLSGELSLEETAALTERAKFFIGVDTAIMHMAAAMDTPVLALFGPSGAFHWGPWDNACMQSGYTHLNGVQRMGRHLVLQVDWACAPCGQDGCEGSKRSDCLLAGAIDWALIERSLQEMAA